MPRHVKPTYFPFDDEAFDRDTRDVLSLAERFVYERMLMIAWRSYGGVLPTDPRAIQSAIASSLGRTNGLRSSTVEMILSKFWTRTPEGWTQKRLAVEVERFAAISAARAEAGKKGGETRKKVDANDSGPTPETVEIPERSCKEAVEKPYRSRTEANGISNDFSGGAEANAKHGGEGRTEQMVDQESRSSDFIHHPPSPLSQIRERVITALLRVEALRGHPVWATDDPADIVNLVAQGFDLDAEIIPIVARIANTPKGRTIRSWRYFVAAITGEREQRNARSPSQQSQPERQRTDDDWLVILRFCRRIGMWQRETLGPAPFEAGCIVPQNLIDPQDRRTWAAYDPSKVSHDYDQQLH